MIAEPRLERRHGTRLAALLLAVICMLASGPVEARQARAGQVAVTFDDLPVFGAVASMADAQAITARLLAGLRRNRIPAIGFVNEVKLQGADRVAQTGLLAAWLGAGEDLGNHGYQHLSLTNTPLAAYTADIARGDVVTRALLQREGRAPHWFRPPYLETGKTLADRQGLDAWLAAHDYRLAPVTMENSDWLFALPYDKAVLRGDKVEATRILAAYVAFTARIVPWYRQAAQAVLGRQPAFVFLLHASRLNADAIDRLAAIYRANDLHPVTIANAMRDKAYAIRDTYVGPDGDEWVTRWGLAMHRSPPWSTLPQAPADIAKMDAALEGNGR